MRQRQRFGGFAGRAGVNHGGLSWLPNTLLDAMQRRLGTTRRKFKLVVSGEHEKG